MKVLAIGPHPDDIEYGCGGTLLKLKDKKVNIFILVMTRGSVGGNSKVRKVEQEKSGDILRAKVLWGGFKDTRIMTNKPSIDTVERFIKKVNPDIIFVNYYNDTHQDHRNTANIVMTASRHSRNILFYEVPTTMNFVPSVFTDIGNLIDKKMELLKAHKSQVYATKVPKLNIVESSMAIAIYRGFQDRVKYAEGFVPLRFSFNLII